MWSGCVLSPSRQCLCCPLLSAHTRHRGNLYSMGKKTHTKSRLGHRSWFTYIFIISERKKKLKNSPRWPFQRVHAVCWEAEPLLDCSKSPTPIYHVAGNVAKDVESARAKGKIRVRQDGHTVLSSWLIIVFRSIESHATSLKWIKISRGKHRTHFVRSNSSNSHHCLRQPFLCCCKGLYLAWWSPKKDSSKKRIQFTEGIHRVLSMLSDKPFADSKNKKDQEINGSTLSKHFGAHDWD